MAGTGTKHSPASPDRDDGTIAETFPIPTVRFLNQFTVGYGNYTEERNQLFEDLTLDGIITEIRRGRAQTDS